MKNKNLEKMIDSLFECTCRNDPPKTPGLYNKPITISFDGLTSEIPFNALNVLTLTNALCHISFTKEYTIEANETMFDIMALEQLIFNLRESMHFDTSSNELKELCEEYSIALEKMHKASERLYNLVPDKDYWKIKEELTKIV